MPYLERSLGPTLRRALTTFPAVLVSGPRQAGKTTLLRHALKGTHRFVSFDLPHVRQQALEDPLAFFRLHRPPLVLDEIQFAPGLLDTIKALIDEDRKPGRFVMTGSQGLSVMQGVSQSLAGRVAVLGLLPLGLDEWRRAPMAARPLDEALKRFQRAERPAGRPVPPLQRLLLRGAYPEPALNGKVDRELWMGSYVQTYLERDVRLLKQVGDLASFTRFLRLCAARTAQVLNLSDLARDTGVSAPTAKQWLSVLEASHEVFLLPPHFSNRSKRLVRSPKLYFSDPALAAYLMGISTPAEALGGPAAGPLFENLVVVEWRKRYLAQGLSPAMSFWRTHDGAEIDLLLERDRRLYAVEVKSTASPNPKHVTSLTRWLADEGKGSQAVLACQCDETAPLGRGILAKPWDQL